MQNLTGNNHAAVSYPTALTLAKCEPPPAGLSAMHSWSWGDVSVPRWGPDKTSVVDVARDFGATPSWVNAKDDDGPKIQAALDQACPAHMAVFIPHGTFHVQNTVYVPAGCALIGAGKHVATISTTAGAFPADPTTPVISVEAPSERGPSISGGGASSTFISDLVIQEEVRGNEKTLDPSAAPLRTLLEVRGRATIRDIRTYRLYITPSRDDVVDTGAQIVYEPASTVSVIGASAGGYLYGLSLDHVAVAGVEGGALLTVNGTQLPLHVYQLSSEHLVTHAMVVIFRSANVHLHAFKFESAGGTNTPGSAKGSGGLLGAHGSRNVSVFGGSGNFGIMDPSLGKDIFFCWGGDGIEIAAIVRHNTPNESAAGMWIKVVSMSGAALELLDMPLSLLRFSTTGGEPAIQRRALQPKPGAPTWEGPGAKPKARSNAALALDHFKTPPPMAPSNTNPVVLLSRGADVTVRLAVLGAPFFFCAPSLLRHSSSSLPHHC